MNSSNAAVNTVGGKYRHLSKFLRDSVAVRHLIYGKSMKGDRWK